MTAPGVVCICVNIAPGRERVVAVFPESIHGAGTAGAWAKALREAPTYGPASKVTVDYWPPHHRGLDFDVPSEVMAQIQAVTP